MSRTFSTSCGSVESLKYSLRWGCKPKACQIRCTLVWLSPLVAALDLVLQWVASRGVDSRVFTTTASTRSSLILRGAPLRGSSSRPAPPPLMNRDRHLPTVALVTCSSSATCMLVTPLAQPSTIRERKARPCAVVRRRVRRSRIWRSSGVTASAALGRPRVGCMQEPSGQREEAPIFYQLSPVQDTSKALKNDQPPIEAADVRRTHCVGPSPRRSRR